MFWSNKNKVSGRPSQADVRSPLALPLEPRMMFDGAVAATVADTAASQPTDTPDAQDTAAAGNSSHDSLAAAPTGGTSDQRQEVVFVDNGGGDSKGSQRCSGCFCTSAKTATARRRAERGFRQ